MLAAASLAHGQETLPGTQPLVLSGDPAVQMVEGIHMFLDRETALAGDRRKSLAATPDREKFLRIIGAVDRRVQPSELQIDTRTAPSPELVRGRTYRMYAVRWAVFDDVNGEGLLLMPNAAVKARVVVIPDADSTLDTATPLARRLAALGCEVVVPILIDRKDTWSGIPGIKMTNQPHREWIYRMAFEAGRHIVGYEVQKILAAVDWFMAENASRKTPIGVAGYGEGGLLALYAAAADPRIDATLVSGYFQPRQGLWKEPIYRDIWGLLRDYGDAEIAAMIAPRSLIVEASRQPDVKGPPTATRERSGAAPMGAITTPDATTVSTEVERARPVFEKLRAPGHLQFIASEAGNGPPFSNPAIEKLLQALGIPAVGASPVEGGPFEFDLTARLHRQFDQLVAHTQTLIRKSEQNRAAFWSRADASTPEKWKRTTQPMRDSIWSEVIGRLPDPSVPPNPRTRLIFDEPKFRGYEVTLDVWPGVFAYGILLVPKNIRPREKRPVVVCQHGLEGRPRDVADPKIDSAYYHAYAARLANEGFITFAPQNPYIGQDRFRQIQRKAHPLKLSLFSFILGQHQRLLEWLGALPFVDGQRIGFYGLSYGGKTAVRVPPLLDGYALSICSADFNEWVWKTTSVDARYSYMLTQEYDMLEFDFANVLNYSDFANLMAPRPFMVERGHDDGVSADEWVAYEYAKTRRFYTKMGLADRTEIEFFNGPHTIHGVGTFAFLRRHLHFPE